MYGVRKLLGAWLLFTSASAACATQREQRPTTAESRGRPTDEPCHAEGKPPSAGATWACGYWHWDSVRYVWVKGRWEPPR